MYMYIYINIHMYLHLPTYVSIARWNTHEAHIVNEQRHQPAERVHVCEYVFLLVTCISIYACMNICRHRSRYRDMPSQAASVTLLAALARAEADAAEAAGCAVSSGGHVEAGLSKACVA